MPAIGYRIAWDYLSGFASYRNRLSVISCRVLSALFGFQNRFRRPYQSDWLRIAFVRIPRIYHSGDREYGDRSDSDINVKRTLYFGRQWYDTGTNLISHSSGTILVPNSSCIPLVVKLIFELLIVIVKLILEIVFVFFVVGVLTVRFRFLLLQFYRKLEYCDESGELSERLSNEVVEVCCCCCCSWWWWQWWWW